MVTVAFRSAVRTGLVVAGGQVGEVGLKLSGALVGWIGVALLLIVQSAGAQAAPAKRTRKAAPAKRTTPARTPPSIGGPRFIRLQVLPASLRLSGPAAVQSVIVMGTLADGSQVDVTDRAPLSLSGKAVTLSNNRLQARSDGKSLLIARYGNLRTQAPVSVAQANRPVAYSFQNDVVPVLARLGCSQGACHGANSGKGGFKLSLRGYAPELDFLSITRELGGRRIAREAPERSLFLRKPLMEVAHGGGKALERGSREYYVLLGWLMQGAPGPDPAEPRLTALEALPGDRVYRAKQRQRVLIRATFSDGHVEDVTERAVFRSNDAGVASVTERGQVVALNPGETAVQAKYMDRLAVVRVTVPYPQQVNPAAFGEPFNYIDQAIDAKLRSLNLAPSGLCTDEEFIRRAYLGALGTLPTADEVRTFLAECRQEAGKAGGVPRRARARLIDGILKRPEYGSIWALKLCDLSMVRREHMQRKNTVALHQWLTEQFQQNRPWDQLVADLVTAAGSIEENPATLWWASRQMTRPNARGWVRHYELTAEIASQVFLGQRMQCAKCHNHPTEKYTQDNYYQFAALFAQVNGEGRADPVPERFVATDPGEVRHPRTGKPVTPRPLDHADLQLQPGEDRRVKFAAWLRGEGRDLFARNIVNRVWARLFGSGIVEPVDDLRSTNPPRNEPLLAALANDLIAHQYDLKYLMGTIMRSRTYQASSQATPANKIDTQFFSHFPAYRLQGEELLDAIAQATGVPDKFATYPLGTRAIELSDTELSSLALDTFGRPNRTTPCECDRSAAPTVSQALDLFNGEALQGKLKHPEGVINQWIRSGKSDAEILEELYLRTLSRRPDATELDAIRKALAQTPKREEGLQDVLWALINTKEFMFNH